MVSATSQAVLRRRSWPIFCAIVLVGLGIGMLAAVLKVTSVNGFRTGWQGVPIYLAVASVMGRIAGCKVILRDDALLVVNPLRTHIVPKVLIRGASVSDDGTLEVNLDEDRSIAAFAFGGSLVDRFRKTSSGAEQEINSWLRSGRAASDAEADLRVRWTRCMPADLAFVLCGVVAGAGAIWMALSSGA
ncbi:hypothetical protein SUDANB51_04734 [Streptomyces sp. enrichment culture]